MKPSIVVPLHPGGGSYLDFVLIMPWSLRFDQLCFVETNGRFREGIVVCVTDRADGRVDIRADKMLGEPKRRVLASGVGMVNEPFRVTVCGCV
jgi:hypothetical protein